MAGNGTGRPFPGSVGMQTADAAVLHAEVAALQAVLISVLRRLQFDRPTLGPLLCEAFDEAETILTGLAVEVGEENKFVTTVEALRVVEEIRAGVLQDESVCTTRPKG